MCVFARNYNGNMLLLSVLCLRSLLTTLHVENSKKLIFATLGHSMPLWTVTFIENTNQASGCHGWGFGLYGLGRRDRKVKSRDCALASDLVRAHFIPVPEFQFDTSTEFKHHTNF